MRTACVLTVAVLAASTVPAAGQGKGQDGPAVEIRLKSINYLLDHVEYIGGLAGQGEQAKQLVGLVKAFSGEKGLEGVDPKKPFGVYASITPNVVDSPVVAMIPIADEEAFLNLLRGRVSLDPKKGDDGVYQMDVPNVPPTVYFKFAKGYAYATVRDKSPLATASLVDAKNFFTGTDPAALTVTVHINRIPADVRKTVFGQLELQLNQEKEKKTPGDSAAQHKLKGVFIDAFANAANTLLTDGRTLTSRLLITPKDDELALDVSLTAAEGSDLSRSLKSVSARKSVARTAARVANPVVAGAVNFGLPAALVEKLGPIVDEILKDAVASSKPDDREAAKKVLESFAPTIKSGNLEFGGAMTRSDSGDRYRVVAALRVKEGAGIDKVVRELAPFAGEKAKVELDAEKVAGKPLHKFVIPNLDENKLFGTESLWWSIGDDLSVLSIEADGREVKRVADEKAAVGEIARFEASVAAAAFAFETKLKRDKLNELVTESFGKESPQGRDTIRLNVTGGEKLTATLSLKGRGVKLLAAMDREKKK